MILAVCERMLVAMYQYQDGQMCLFGILGGVFVFYDCLVEDSFENGYFPVFTLSLSGTAREYGYPL